MHLLAKGKRALQAGDLREKGLGVTAEQEEARPGQALWSHLPSPTHWRQSPKGTVDWRSLFADTPWVHWLTVSGLDEAGMT